MSQEEATAKGEGRPGKKPFQGNDIRASLEADARVWREMQQTLMMSLEPWLKIQADLARHVEIAVQMAQLASQSEQYLKASERKEELHSAIARWEAIASSIKLPEYSSKRMKSRDSRSLSQKSGKRNANTSAKVSLDRSVQHNGLIRETLTWIGAAIQEQPRGC